MRDPKVFNLSDADRQYWAFQPLNTPKLPPGDTAHPIDRFIEARLEKESLVSLPQTSREVLIRRAYFGLIGLPPSYDDVRTFINDPAVDAYERMIDRLLASPRYGERWGRHWLDVVRFAQTNGYERDDEKPYAWRYRDYVINAFNADKPYHRFILEQIAGDELADGGPEGIVATGFYRLGVWDDEPDDERQARMDELDDMVKVTSETFLGLTMGCARCHHHMFDAVSQEDYYAMLAFFQNVQPYTHPKYGPESATYAPIAEPDKVKAWRREWREKKRAYEALSPDDTEEKKRLEQEINRYDKEAPFQGGVALTLRESGDRASPTHVLIRGDAGTPGKEVAPAFPVIFDHEPPQIVVPESRHSTGRRKALAEWIANERHPLTVRVMVNRVWKHHFGKGIVETTNDFGAGGVPPTHPDLLDWLASDFVRHGWSVKRLHRLILTSAAYRRDSSSHHHNETRDPGNRFLWRQNLRRLEAEVIRDRILVASGAANFEMKGRGFFPIIAGEVLAGGSRPGRGWDASSQDQRARRSVYAFVKRTMMVPFLEAFDYSNTEGSLGDRSSTTVPTQALMLLNSELVNGQAKNLARRLHRESGNNGSAFVRQAFRHILEREPDANELQLGQDFLEEQTGKQLGAATEIRFRPEVPAALERVFRDRLPPDRFLVGPETGWHYDKGAWGGGYEGIMVVDPTRGPTAMLDFAVTPHDTIGASLHFEENVETAGVVWETAEETRCELLLDLKTGRLQVRCFQGDAIDVLVDHPLASVKPWNRFSLRDGKLQWNGDTFETPEPAGRIGLRVWGDGMRVRDFEVKRGNNVFSITEHGIDEGRTFSREALAQERAAAEFCALLFNLNEFIHVD